MAGEYRIAEGFVEVVVRPDREKLRQAAQEAADEFERASAGRYSGAGAHAGEEFAAGAKTSLGRDLETVLSDTGSRGGTDFVMAVDRVLTSARSKVKRTGEDLGADLLKGIGGGGGGSGSGGVTNLFSGIGAKLSSVFTGASATAHQAFDDIKQGVSQISDAFSGLSKVAGIAWGVIKFAGGPGGGLELLPPLLAAIGGGLASLPALALGAGAALATLELGTQGIGAAIGQVFNPTSGGGGGAANRLEQIASAERNLASAERNEREAQQALTDARVQAAFHLQDLNLQMERQQENERGAALAILEAQQALMAAQATGDPLQIMRAQLGLREAVTGLKEAKQQTVELSDTKQQADAKGVEGSDQVVSALDRVQNASNAVIDAQNSVKQASISAAAGAVTAYSKLSPEAKKFVDEIARLKPQLVDLQHYVQDRMFAGLDKKLGMWATVWMPHLRTDLGLLAGDANTFATRLGDDLSKPQMTGALDKVAGAMDRVFTRFTSGGTLDKVITALADLVDKATPFIEGLANSAIDKIGSWADTLDKAAKDGRLASFFKEASKDLHDIWNIGSDVAKIVSDILTAAFNWDTSGHDGKNGLDRLKDSLDKLDAWASSADGKKTIKGIVVALEGIANAIGWIIIKVGWMVDALVWGYTRTRRTLQSWRDDFADMRDSVGMAFDKLALDVSAAFDTMVGAATHAFSWVPGLGPKLDSAKRDMDGFVAGFNSDMDHLQTEKDIRISIRAAASVGGAAGAAALSLLRRWGGVDYAADGLVSLGNQSAGIYSGGPMYGFAEPDTGGELFMPRNGDRSRNQALATVAAQWAGMDAVPARSPIAAGMGMTGGANTTKPHTLQPVQIHVGGTHLVDLVIGVVQDHPVVVSATAAEGDRRRRFTNSARA